MDTQLLSGILYEIDMRLRPSGDSGLLVTHINFYEDYLKNEAWTWEHQALVRSRFIAGDLNLKNLFESIRQRTLCLPRLKADLQTEVREMREKMRAALDTKESGKFDLKQGKGGIADIEFIVQFGVLAEAQNFPDLTVFTDNVRLLEGLKAHGFISEAEGAILTDAYCAYRDVGHKQVLQGGGRLGDSAEHAGMRAAVERLWQKLMEAY
jgi:glutamate-ammonia-ligase adenylyltransferase